jgi:hypothetical protein
MLGKENEEVIAPVVYAFPPSTPPMLTEGKRETPLRKKKVPRYIRYGSEIASR